MTSSFNAELQELPLGVPRFRRKAESFLAGNSLRLEDLDLYLAVLDENGDILAGGGLKGDVVKCVAVSEAARSQGLAAPLVSRLVSIAAEKGFTSLKVFTKPENAPIFESLGFRVLARAPKAVLMENGRGLADYCASLRALRAGNRAGVIVMNANPFTLGHLHLVREAAAQVDRLFIIPVAEEGQRFSYAERVEMIRKAAGPLATVVEGSAWQISSATFPTYFLKDLSDASETQMRLDLDLFRSHIAPALGVCVRFVGSEPLDALTARYNALMGEMLPECGIGLVEIPRLCDAAGPVSASRVRASLDAGSYPCSLVPESSSPYLLADLADRALMLELETPLKPGLVSPESNGAHNDMDYALMRIGIATLRPFWHRMATAGDAASLQQAGLEAERAMLDATGGVNTHRGAIFCLGLALAAAAFGRKMQNADIEHVMQKRLVEIAGAILRNRLSYRELYFTHGREAVTKFHVSGAMEMALGGYKDLFGDWLPYYRSVKAHPYALQRTLLRIMSILDDTCIIHRAGYGRAQQVKKESAALLDVFSPEALASMDAAFRAERISPGGCADMLSLVIFTDSILSTN